MEKTDLVSPEGHKAIEEEAGGSMVDADEATRQRVAKRLDAYVAGTE